MKSTGHLRIAQISRPIPYPYPYPYKGYTATRQRGRGRKTVRAGERDRELGAWCVDLVELALHYPWTPSQPLHCIVPDVRHSTLTPLLPLRTTCIQPPSDNSMILHFLVETSPGNSPSTTALPLYRPSSHRPTCDFCDLYSAPPRLHRLSNHYCALELGKDYDLYSGWHHRIKPTTPHRQTPGRSPGDQR